jgi:hypothetical protein
MIIDVPVEIRTDHFTNTSFESFLQTNLFGETRLRNWLFLLKNLMGFFSFSVKIPGFQLTESYDYTLLDQQARPACEDVKNKTTRCNQIAESALIGSRLITMPFHTVLVLLRRKIKCTAFGI